MLPDRVLALISLPPSSGDTTLLALLLVVLLTVIVAGRAILAWHGLAARAAGARRRQARVEEAEEDMHGTFGRLRAETRELNAGVERVLWSLPRFDERMARARAKLAEDRARLEELRHHDARARAGTVARIRGTLSMLRSTRELRRTILG